MADRQEWEHATAGSRHLAIAADAELRRRHPNRKIEPLRSAEPASARGTDRELLHQALEGDLTEPSAWIRDLAVQHQAFRARMHERQRQVAPSEALEWPDRGQTSPFVWAPCRDAILQPPRPETSPSVRILQLAAEHDIEPEAGG
jgi:hypothetical protein